MSELFVTRQNATLFTSTAFAPAGSVQPGMRRRTPPVRHPKGAHSSLLPQLFEDLKPPLPQGKFTVVSMFSGCGGMDLGFRGGFKLLDHEYDPLPFEVVWANEHNAAACRTYRKNMGVDIKCEKVWNAIDSLPKHLGTESRRLRRQLADRELR